MDTKNIFFEFCGTLNLGKMEYSDLNWPGVNRFTVYRQVESIDVVCMQ